MNIMDIKKPYTIMPDSRKTSHEEEYWRNNLSNGKSVILIVCTTFNYCKFIIELTDTEKEAILKKEDNIILNNYGATFLEAGDSYDEDHNFVNEETFTEEELLEIQKKIPDFDCGVFGDQELLEINGWEHYDTIYSFSSGCELILIEDAD